MRYILVLFLLLLGCSDLGPKVNAQSPQATIQTRCLISMRAWCIATGVVESMQDVGPQRIWKLDSGEADSSGPIVILENRNCDSLSQIGKASFKSDSIENNGEHSTRVLILLLDAKADCELRFEFPAFASSTREYERMLRFGIFIFGRELSSYWQK